MVKQISFNFFLLKLKVQTTVWKLNVILWVGTIVKVSVKQQKEINSSFTLQLHKTMPGKSPIIQPKPALPSLVV